MKRAANEYGAELDGAGYTPSIIQRECCCAKCGRTWGKLDRHEPWGASNRSKSKALGMWVYLCHEGCHEGPGSVHENGALARQFRKDAQRAAMIRYGWSREEFIRRFGKNELSAEEAAHIFSEEITPEEEDFSMGHDDAGFRVLDEALVLPF